MNKFITQLKLGASLLILSLPLAAAAQKTVDPLFTQWASFNVGSSLTSSSGDGMTRVETLKEKGDDYVVIGLVANGTPMEDTKITRFYTTDVTVQDRGQEPVDVAGKTFPCHHYTMRYTVKHMVDGKLLDDGKAFATDDDWFTPEVPGVVKYSGQFPDFDNESVTDTNTDIAVSWEKK